jgi:O-antigen biosynthesis protein WbqP
MKRLFSLSFSIMLLVLSIIPMLIIAITIRLTSKGPALYWSARVGKDNKIFKMAKFRTMQITTPVVATHLLEKPHSFLSPIGPFLRSTSLDELPQLLSVIKGDMAFIGPRPALFNQNKLIALRSKKGIAKLLPGITGWAQVNGRDELTIIEKVAFDEEYMHHQSFWLDIKILGMTFLNVIRRIGVNH